MRERSDKPTRNNGWLHIFRDDAPDSIISPRRAPAPKPAVERAPDERITAVYAELTREHLVLSQPHRESLKHRGLSDGAIGLHAYRSTPTAGFAANIAPWLARHYDLRGVPGFYRQGNEWRLNFGEWHQGIVIPVRDTHECIVGLMIRRDEAIENKYTWLTSTDKPDGLKADALPHFARVDVARATGKIVVTEGALKSNVISELTGEAVVGIAGVSNFPESFGQDLRRAIPELKSAVVAYDADFRTNEAVRRGLDKVAANLQSAGLNVTVILWKPERGKGFDNVLAASKEVAA